MEVTDTDLVADPNREAKFTIVDNKKPWSYSAGSDILANIEDGGTAALAGVVKDDGKFPLKTIWYVDDGPLGADLGAITFDPDNHTLDAVVTFVEQGEYTLRLELGDHSETLDWDANDFLTATVDPKNYARITLRPSDDTRIRGGNAYENENYGARDKIQSRNGTAAGSNHFVSYVKFDLNEIKGNIQISEFSIRAAEAQNSAATIIYDTTYGESGEWFEGEDNGSTDPYIGEGLTYMKKDLIRGPELDRWRTSYGNWNNGVRKRFDTSSMTIEENGKVTFEVFSNQKTTQKDWWSKEGFNTNNDPPTYRGPLLLVAYDPNMPYYPSPGNRATGVEPTTDLAWKAHGSTSFDVYFSTSITLVANRDGGVFLGTVAAAVSLTDPNATIDPTPGIDQELPQGARYYWAVDGDNGIKGEIWTFMNVDKPVLVHPDPKGKMTILPGRPSTDPSTSQSNQPEFYEWTGGATSESFDLYLSTNESDVINMVSPAATDISSPFDPNQRVVLALSNGSGMGEDAVRYYWRIVGNQASGPAMVSEIGSFAVTTYERIDNFNDHKPPPDDQTGLDNYTGKWTAEGGASLTWMNSASPGTSGIGGSAIKLNYSGDSMAKFRFVEPRNWSLSINRAIFRLQYLGVEYNDLDVVKLRITDTGGGTHTESYSSAPGGEFQYLDGYVWHDKHQVKLSLKPFAAAGVDMTSIKSYSLGVGDGTGATGTIYFDSIRLYSTSCDSSKYPFLFAGGDCDVDVNELTVIAEKWLHSSVTVNASAIPADKPLLYFPFEGTLSSDTTNGIVGGTLTENKGSATVITSDWAPGGISTQCIRVTRTTQLQWTGIHGGTLGAANPSASLSIWLKGNKITSNLTNAGRMNRVEVLELRASTTPTGNAIVMDLRLPQNDGTIQMILDSFIQGEGNKNLTWSQNNTQPSDWQWQWNHIAVVWDGVTGITSLYHNGLMVDQEGYWPSDAGDKIEIFQGGKINWIRVPDQAANNGTGNGGYGGPYRRVQALQPGTDARRDLGPGQPDLSRAASDWRRRT